ncbi:MAG: hypothetical protein U9N54_03485 [candidate division Zixibacteria bacterium]|nr:hypothetical protein [candidate division Zixibacteria bacterium]
MRILINDIMQFSDDAPDEIKSPALSDIYTDTDNFTFSFDEAKTINCIGFGYTDATQIQITNDTDTKTITITKDAPYQNGLYIIDSITTKATVHTFKITHNGSYIGRVAIGTYRTLGTGISKENGFYTSNENRVTKSGAVIPGLGGFSGRSIDLDVRYKIDEDVYDDIEFAYSSQIMRGFPFFLQLNDEQHKLSANMFYFYGRTTEPITKLQSSTYKFLYSYKFMFLEAF